MPPQARTQREAGREQAEAATCTSPQYRSLARIRGTLCSGLALHSYAGQIAAPANQRPSAPSASRLAALHPLLAPYSWHPKPTTTLLGLAGNVLPLSLSLPVPPTATAEWRRTTAEAASLRLSLVLPRLSSLILNPHLTTTSPFSSSPSAIDSNNTISCSSDTSIAKDCTRRNRILLKSSHSTRRARRSQQIPATD